MSLMDGVEGNINLKRGFNRALERIIRKYDNIFPVNIDSIHPDNTSLFEAGTFGGLSVKGYEIFWNTLDDRLERVDKGDLAKFPVGKCKSPKRWFKS